eukprot:scaffold719_cov226-Pinguiococcus_pyrenoidosus.AAC.10
MAVVPASSLVFVLEEDCASMKFLFAVTCPVMCRWPACWSAVDSLAMMTLLLLRLLSCLPVPPVLHAVPEPGFSLHVLV